MVFDLRTYFFHTETMSMVDINELLDAIEDSDSEPVENNTEPEQLDIKPADDADNDDEYEPPVIEWDESSGDENTNEVVEPADKKPVAIKGSGKKLNDKPKTARKNNKATKSADSSKNTARKNTKSTKSTKSVGPKAPKLHHCEAPPGTALIIQQQIQFGTSLTEQQIEQIGQFTDRIVFENDNSSARILFNDWEPCSRIIDAVEAIRSICKRDKVAIKGNVYMIQRDSNVAEITTGVIKINSRHPVFTECQYKITVLAEKKEADAKKLTNDEKMELFRQYYEEHRKLPEKKEVYKEFKVGQFYDAAMKNKNMVSQIDEIVGSVQ